MGKSLFIAEKPSVAQEFAKVLKITGKRGDGYLESENAIVTWCVGHLVTMSYPEAYDPVYKRWSMDTLPFLPKEFKYQVIDGVAKQFKIVSGLLNRSDVETIYVCTDSGREGEYIYRLVEQMAGVKGKTRRRVWIDSQTEEEILRGVREAKELSEYDNLAASAYLRAKEDYLMGINFSRVLTLKYGPSVASYLREKRAVLSVGRVMTCVLGMVVRREREIRTFVKTPFFRVLGTFRMPGQETAIEAEWRAVEGSKYFGTPALYKENGFREKKDAEALVAFLSEPPMEGTLLSVEKKRETKNAPLLYNLAELQNDCSKLYKISPDETLKIVQELYEKKLVTYPRTDARVLSSAVAKEIQKNIGGLRNVPLLSGFASEVLENGAYKKIAGTRYVNDKQITDHYAIIPTGQGLSALRGLGELPLKVYELIGRRFLAIFYPSAVYQKVSLHMEKQGEHFFSSYRVLAEEGYFKVTPPPQKSAKAKKERGRRKAGKRRGDPGDRSRPGREGRGASFHVKELKKRREAGAYEAFHQGRRDDAAQAVHLRLHDPCHGKCRSAHRGRRSAGPDQGQRHRHQRYQGGDFEKAFQHQVSVPGKENPGHYADAFRGDRLRRGERLHETASESGAYGKLGKGAYLRGRGHDHAGGVHGKAEPVCGPSYRQREAGE